MSTIIHIPDKGLSTSHEYAEWKAKSEQGAACDYQQPWFTNTDYTSICTGTPVIRWKGVRRGRRIRTAYCIACAASQSPPRTWTEPVILTILPGCPDGLREWAQALERVIAARTAADDAGRPAN